MKKENLNKALCLMAPGTPEYNRGVLATLGLESMAIKHEMLSRRVLLLVQQRDSMIPDGGHLFEHIEIDHGTNAIQQRIYTEVYRRNEAWRPIQALIIKARGELVDPLPWGSDD